MVTALRFPSSHPCKTQQAKTYGGHLLIVKLPAPCNISTRPEKASPVSVISLTSQTSLIYHRAGDCSYRDNLRRR